MSNDLISRNAVIKEINEYLKSAYDCDGIEGVSDLQRGNESKQSYIVEGLYEAFELIGNVPTAYDVYKVVGQINDLVKPTAQYRHNFCGTVTDEHCAKYDGCESCMAEQICKVVKSGGIE